MSLPSFMHHQQHTDVCLYCLKPWPCASAKLLMEAADYITERARHHAEFQREAMEHAASLIRPKEEIS
jgi:hypothetical protein